MLINQQPKLPIYIYIYQMEFLGLGISGTE